MRTRNLAGAAIVAAGVFVLAACASVGAEGAGPHPSGGADAVSQEGTTDELMAQATVLQRGDDDEPRLCLSVVYQSYPPQCTGPAIHGWDWAAVEQSETSLGVTWGDYVVYGTWDGVSFTTTRDPVPYVPPSPPPGVGPGPDIREPGLSDEAELLRVQSDVRASDYPTVLMSWPDNGYLILTVIHDDGTVQDAVDAKYGPNVVIVRSALQPAD